MKYIFFKHLLFDQYFDNDIGNKRKLVATIFAQYLTQFVSLSPQSDITAKSSLHEFINKYF